MMICSCAHVVKSIAFVMIIHIVIGAEQRWKVGEAGMSLDKAIKHGKEHRKQYTGSKSIDRTCRNHGGCLWCEENRKHKMRDKHPQEHEGR